MLNKRSDYLVIIVATYNRLKLLKKTINSIASGTHCSHEIIVIDGGSTDGTIEFLRSHPGVTPVFQGKLIGQARACNQIWRQIESKYTCWLNDDTELVPGSLDLAVQILEKDSSIGMVGLKMIDTDGRGTFSHYGGALSEYRILNCNHGVLATSLLRSVGYFNEDYRTYTIDPDLTASILSSGKGVVLTKQIGVHHHRAELGEEQQEMRKRELLNNLPIYREKFKFLEASSYLSFGWRRKIRKALLNFLYIPLSRKLRRFELSERDQTNLLKGRFIRPMDPLDNMFRQYYLVQKIPRKLLLSSSNPYRHLVRKVKI